jgi:hypothetical protein
VAIDRTKLDEALAQIAAARDAISVALTAAQAADSVVEHEPPTASFTATVVDLAVSVDATGSADPDGGAIASYAWDFGDGATGSGVTASHTYAAGGTYTVTLTVTDDRGATGTAAQSVSAAAPAPTPTESMFAIGVTATYLRGLPQTGPEWDRLKAMADRALTFDPADGALDGSGDAFCAGLMYVATGVQSYADKVTAMLDTIVAHGPVDWWHAAANRKAGGWALAAQLVGYDTPAWRSFLRAMLDTAHAGHNRSGVMHDCAWDWDNNHGGAAMQSYAAICAVLGIREETIAGTLGGLDHLAKWLKAWCGDTSEYGFHVTATKTYGGLGKTDPTYSDTWQHDPARPAGVVQSSILLGETVDPAKEGAVPSDVIRENSAFPTIGGSATNYVYGNAGRRVNAAIILAANGHPGVWEWGDRALLRWRQWCDRNAVAPSGAQNQHADSTLNAVYGTAFPAVPSTGEVITCGDWLALGGSWPVRA